LNIKKYLRTNNNYIILAVVFLTLAVSVGVQSTFGVFFVPMSKEFGWNRATTSGPFTLYLVIWGLLSIIFGRLSDRVSAWKLISCGAVFLGTGFVLMSTVRSIWQLYMVRKNVVPAQ
jgi:MFS family permease